MYDISKVMQLKNSTVIRGHVVNNMDMHSVHRLVSEMLKLEEHIVLNYNPREETFSIQTDADMEESVFQKLAMFASGFLTALSITIIEER